MDVVFADKRALTPLGKQGENEVTKIKFKKEDWEDRYGIGFYTIFNQRPNDPAPYPCITEDEGRYITWVVKNSDLAQKGQGMCQLVYTVDNKVAKSVIFHTVIFDSLGDDSVEPPEPWSGWVQEVIDAKTDAETAAEESEASADRAEEASGHYPYINEANFHWMVWNVEAGEYVDTGIGAKGGSVYSVNGKDGDVHLDAEDVGALPDDTYIPTKTSDLTNDSDFATNASVTAAVAAETIRATAAEQTITGNLNEEISRATDAEEALDDRIDSEISRAQSAEDELGQALQAEQGRAEDAEDELDDKITAEVNRATAAEATKASVTALNEEISRATGEEQTIQESVNAEVTRAEEAESEIAQDISDEVTRATEAEADLSDAINAEESRAEGVESTLDGKITAETARAEEAESNISASVTAETNRAEEAEEDIAADITAETNRATTAENAISESVTAETNRAIAAEATKVDKIEGKGLSANDYTDTEKTKLAGIAMGAEVNVQSDWNQTNTSADDYVKNKPNLSVYALDADLESHVTNQQNPHQVTKSQVGLGNVDNTSDTNKPISAATQAALNQKANSSALAAETERATASEGALSDAIAAETERATGVETEQSSRIAQLQQTKADKAVLSFFDRRMRYIYEHAEKQFFDIEDDTTEAYSKLLPSGVMGVGVNMIGAKSYVKNQLVQNGNFADSSGWSAQSGTLSIANNKATLTSSVATSAANINRRGLNIVKDHKYLLCCTITTTVDNRSVHIDIYDNSAEVLLMNVRGYSLGAAGTHTVKYIITASNNATNGYIYLYGAYGQSLSVGETITFSNCYLVDLTQWFNGDSTILASITTPEDAYALGVPRTYIPYNEGEVISADCDEVKSQGKNLLQYPYYDTTKTIRGITFTDNGDGSITVNGTVTGETAYFNFIQGQRWFINSINDNGFYFSITGDTQNVTTGFNKNNGLLYMRCAVGITYNNQVIYPMVEKGDSATSYSPYMVDSMNIPDTLREEHPLHSANGAYDEYNIERKFTKVAVGDVDMGTLTWTRYAVGGGYIFYGDITDGKKLTNNFIQEKYVLSIAHDASALFNSGDKHITSNGGVTTGLRLLIRDDSYNSADAFKTAMNGVHIYYELATPIYYYDPTSPELAVNGGTVVPDATHIVDEESYFPTTSNLLEAEAGGSLTFHQDGDTEFPVPNSTTYLVNTDEAAQS